MCYCIYHIETSLVFIEANRSLINTFNILQDKLRELMTKDTTRTTSASPQGSILWAENNAYTRAIDLGQNTPAVSEEQVLACYQLDPATDHLRHHHVPHRILPYSLKLVH